MLFMASKRRSWPFYLYILSLRNSAKVRLCSLIIWIWCSVSFPLFMRCSISSSLSLLSCNVSLLVRWCWYPWVMRFFRCLDCFYQCLGSMKSSLISFTASSKLPPTVILSKFSINRWASCHLNINFDSCISATKGCSASTLFLLTFYFY